MAAAPSARVTRYQGDLQDPDVATAQTVELMCEFINRTAQDPLVQRAARDAVNRFRGGPLYACAGIDPWQSDAAKASSVWFWVKHLLKFVHHDGLIQVWLNEREQLQLLISPDLLLRMSKPRGDCAIYTMLECAMLEALGLEFEIVTAAVTPDSPVYDHVWARCILPNGKRLNLDASHGKYPGWQVPFEHRNRTQVWDMQGNPVDDRAPRPLGDFQARPNKPILPKQLALVPGVTVRDYQRFQRGLGFVERRGVRYPGLGLIPRRGVRWPGLAGGLGQDGSDTVTVLNPSLDPTNVPVTNPPSGYPVAPATSTGMNPFEQALAQSAPGLLAAWTNIAGRVIAPTVQYTGPGGVTYSAPASSAAASGIPLSLGTTTSSLLPWLIGGVLVFVLIKGVSK